MIQLVIRHNDNSLSYYSVLQTWRIDQAMGMIVVDRDLPRKMIPLVNVKDITIEEVTVNATREGGGS
jgi:hypothetical protein